MMSVRSRRIRARPLGLSESSDIIGVKIHALVADFYEFSLYNKNRFDVKVKSVLLVCFLFIRAVKKIIYRYVVEIGKLNKNFGGDVKLSALIVAVNALTAGQNFAHLLLSKVAVLSQVANSFVMHRHHPNNSIPYYSLAENTLLTFSGKSATMAKDDSFKQSIAKEISKKYVTKLQNVRL